MSPYACQDMSGNVWEWCRTKYNEPDDNSLEGDVHRVLRGGAFYDKVRYVRCAFRSLNFNPNYRNNYLGFRVVVSPFS
jgi:formylglycine-generating enzyme required for sulfatase activity